MIPQKGANLGDYGVLRLTGLKMDIRGEGGENGEGMRLRADDRAVFT